LLLDHLILAYNRDSTVSIATSYKPEGLWNESQWRRDICTCPDQSLGSPSLLYNAY